ncbi:MAG: hypothetical protein WC791_04375 [Candidatus Paceibacterota bacterium]|jgi:hypothetical protein
METKEFEVNRELKVIRNYGFFVLAAFLILNTTTLATLTWFETNDLRHELASLSEKLPSRSATTTEQAFALPEDIISLHATNREHEGFYKTRIIDREYLAYANPDKNYILLKSEDAIRSEGKNFALALFALFAGEIIIILGWWFFIRARVRQLFEIK